MASQLSSKSTGGGPVQPIATTSPPPLDPDGDGLGQGVCVGGGTIGVGDGDGDFDGLGDPLGATNGIGEGQRADALGDGEPVGWGAGPPPKTQPSTRQAFRTLSVLVISQRTCTFEDLNVTSSHSMSSTFRLLVM